MHRITPPGQLRLEGDDTTFIVNGDDVCATANVTKLAHPLERPPRQVGHFDGLAELVDEASFGLVIQRGHNHPPIPAMWVNTVLRSA